MKTHPKRTLLFALAASASLCTASVFAAGSGGFWSATGTSPSSSLGAPANSPDFNSLDQNGDGLISLSEAQADPALEQAFGQSDSSGDGYLNKSEYVASGVDHYVTGGGGTAMKGANGIINELRQQQRFG